MSLSRHSGKRTSQNVRTAGTIRWHSARQSQVPKALIDNPRCRNHHFKMSRTSAFFIYTFIINGIDRVLRRVTAHCLISQKALIKP